MLLRRPDSPFWFNIAATALFGAPARRTVQKHVSEEEWPFGEPQSSDEPHDLELRRAHERGRGRGANHPLQVPWHGWYDILWRTYREMQSDRLLSIAGGVAFFVLLSIFPAITALVSAYALFFNASKIIENLSVLNDVVPGNVLSIVHEQAVRIVSNSGRALTTGLFFGLLVSLWSAMSGVKAIIDALNVVYEQNESRSFIKLNLVALAFTLAGFAAFLLAIGAIIVLPLLLSPIGFGSLAETLTRIARWPVLFLVLLIGLAVLYRYGPARRAARWQWVTVGSVSAAVTWIVASFLFLLVSHKLRQLQRHVRFARRRRGPDDLAVDFNHCRAARRGA